MCWSHGFDVEFERDLLVLGEEANGLFVKGEACGPVFPTAVAAQDARAV